MKRTLLLSIIVLFYISCFVFAENIRGIDIEFVTIGNPGNPGDIRLDAFPSGCGAVDYTYKIGKYEITNGQWEAFIFAAGAPTGNLSSAYNQNAYHTGMDIPTNNVSWYEVAQFCNYLTSGDKSQGAYLFSGNNTNPGDYLGIDRNSAVSVFGTIFVIPTEDEWYKAAYYTGSGYSTYANGTRNLSPPGIDTNFNYAIGHPWAIRNGTQEQNGTFDIMGNVSEWNESLTLSYRGIRGGSYLDGSNPLKSSNRSFRPPDFESSDIGFRVASVPEPTTLLLLGVGGLLIRKR